MIQVGTKLNITDNSGAKIVKCIRILGGTRKRYAYLGDKIIASVKQAEPRSQVKKGEVRQVIVVRQKKAHRRADGSYIRFDDNAGIIFDKEASQPNGTRIFGPVPRELRDKGFLKVISMAQEVL